MTAAMRDPGHEPRLDPTRGPAPDGQIPMPRMAAIGALLGALGVATGALGAHGLKATLSEQALGWWQTGASYHLVHAVALLVCAVAPRPDPDSSRGRARGLAAFLFALGVLVFSGSLYVMALTDLRALGAVTPIGGVAFIAGWLALAYSFWPSRRDA